MISYLNNTSALRLSIMLTCNFVLVQPSTPSEQFFLFSFTHMVWVDPWQGFQALSQCASHWDYIARLRTSSSQLSDKSTMTWFQTVSHDQIQTYMSRYLQTLILATWQCLKEKVNARIHRCQRSGEVGLLWQMSNKNRMKISCAYESQIFFASINLFSK